MRDTMRARIALSGLIATALACGPSSTMAQPAARARPASGAATGQVIVRFKAGASSRMRAASLRRASAVMIVAHVGSALVADVHGIPPRAAVRRLRSTRAVAWAERSLPARAADFVPNDSGVAGPASGSSWTDVQWALTGEFGINVTRAWSQVDAAGGTGGRGVIVAVVDSGVAYADRDGLRRSPDLSPNRFVRGYDFIDDDPYPNDAYGHGTLVASTIAATANNGYGTVGVAYGARIMPLQVLDAQGRGSVPAIASAIRYAADHRADIINLSIEIIDVLRDQRRVARSLTSSRLIREALSYARTKGVLVVAAAGNSYAPEVPARRYGFLTLDVGGATEHGCLGAYSNHGPGLDLVAPGGGPDASLTDDPHCLPGGPAGRDIAGVTFDEENPRLFLIPLGRHGTSVAAPDVSGVAALVLAAGVIGRHPSPAALERRLLQSARDLGAPGPDRYYGAGLLDAAAATAP